jgi:LmbE family N-acetylglucosaminyl deacetylase
MKSPGILSKKENTAMKILAIFAHPDDESYGPAGTLARATHEGHAVALLTLTHGESASLGISRQLSAENLAERRSQELKSAAEKIGIQKINLLDLADKKLQYIPDQNGTSIICNEITSINPDILITYHDNTISGHPDHLAVTKWVINAVKQVQNPPKLFLYGLDQTQTSMIDFQRLFAVTQSEITHKINVEGYISVKSAAIRCHKTQSSLWQQFGEHNIDLNDLFRWEVFVQEWPEPENRRIKHDLFE